MQQDQFRRYTFIEGRTDSFGGLEKEIRYEIGGTGGDWH